MKTDEELLIKCAALAEELWKTQSVGIADARVSTVSTARLTALRDFVVFEVFDEDMI